MMIPSWITTVNRSKLRITVFLVPFINPVRRKHYDYQHLVGV